MNENEQGSMPASSADSLRQAGCKVISQYLPGYDPKCDSEEVFGITRSQFDEAVKLEVYRCVITTRRELDEEYRRIFPKDR